ncbi:hypothetical protein J4558_25605 [Leptolyngbya sp. 15MV]|nr:hypothetical protein J4558_25605 [Leptolyngbya sp. 15MV]
MFGHLTAPRRVVVTGMGIACPLGVGVEHVWKRMTAGESGIGAIQSFDVSQLPGKIAGQVPTGPAAEGKLDVAEWIPVKDVKKMDRFIQFALVAAEEAVRDAGWTPDSEEDRVRTGVMIGSGIGGLSSIYEGSVMIKDGRSRRLSPFFIPSALINLASGHVSIRYGFKGPNHSVVTACATGVHALGDAARLIALGDAEVMVAGGAEAGVSEIGLAGFCASRALSTSFNDTPTKGSRLKNLFALDYIAFVERLEEDRPKLMKVLGLPDPGPFGRENTAETENDILEPRPPPIVTPAAERLLRRLTDLDRQLYRLARQHMG